VSIAIILAQRREVDAEADLAAQPAQLLVRGSGRDELEAAPDGLLSAPDLPRALAALLARLPVLETHPGFWTRAGQLRAKLLARKQRARLADTLVAQSCLDHGVHP